MIKKIFPILCGLALMAGPLTTKAQVDPHYSQYYAYPLWLNPALTGVIDGDVRVTANYRNQWSTIGSPFSTAAVSADAITSKNLGFGVTILNQAAGSAGFNYLNALGSVSYRIRMGGGGFDNVVFGVQAGIINRRFDPSKLRLGDQFNPLSGYDPSMPSGEMFQTTSSTVFDGNAGIMYYNSNPDVKLNPFLGVSAAHLTQPKDPFQTGSTQRLPIRYAIHGGFRIAVSQSLNLSPNGIYLRQGNADEIVAGLSGQYMMPNGSSLLFGSNYRVNDAAIIYTGYNFSNYVFGVSYDFNTSTLNKVGSGNGSLEISVSYLFRKKLTDPNFICPRL